jgi:hypothetical protein
MSARQYTAEELIASVRLRARVPNVKASGSTDPDLLRLLNEEQWNELVPWLMRQREEYYVVEERIPLVAGKTKYRINHRAIGQKLRDIVLVDNANDNRRQMIPRINREERPYHDTPYTAREDEGFFLEGNNIVLVSVDATANSMLEVAFFFRPGEIVMSTAARKVLTIDTATKTITVDGVIPSDWTNADLFDIHSAKSGAEPKMWDQVATTVAGETLIFTSAIDGSAFGTQAVEVGDWVCLAEEAALPALPRELHPVLAQAAVCRVVEAEGDTEALRNHSAKLNRMLEQSISMLDFRVEGKVQKIAGAYSPLWGGHDRRGRYA